MTTISFIETNARWAARIRPEEDILQICAFWQGDKRLIHFTELVEHEELRKELSSEDQPRFQSAYAAYGDVLKNGKTYDHGRDNI